jgi:hypothetical protein
MNVFTNPIRRQAHIHLPMERELIHAALISQEGLHHQLELQPHGVTNYMVRWSQDLPSGTYQLAVKTHDGERISSTVRIR